MKTNFFILIIVLWSVMFVACSDNCTRKPPKWEAPQSIDTLLLGGWKMIEGENLNIDLQQIITFYENNKYFSKVTRPNGKCTEGEHRWSINGDTLVLPDVFDSRTGRFNDYTYSFNYDRNLLYVKFINYPWVGDCEFTMEGMVMPFLTNKGTFKKMEDE